MNDEGKKPTFSVPPRYREQLERLNREAEEGKASRAARPRLMNATPRNASPKGPAPEPSARRPGPVIVDYLEEFPPWLQEREGEDAT